MRSLTPVTELSKRRGFTNLPPSCNQNYFGYWQILDNKKRRKSGVLYLFSHGVPMRNNFLLVILHIVAALATT